MIKTLGELDSFLENECRLSNYNYKTNFLIGQIVIETYLEYNIDVEKLQSVLLNVMPVGVKVIVKGKRDVAEKWLERWERR